MADLQLLGTGAAVAIFVRALTWITEIALKDERMVSYPALFQTGLLQPGKEPLTARPNERRVLFVFCQAPVLGR